MSKIFSECLIYFLAAACTQNLLLTTGLGSSLMVRFLRRPYGIRLFSKYLIIFCLLTSLTFYPLDTLVLSRWDWMVYDVSFTKLLRPLFIMVITSFWYLIVLLIIRKKTNKQYAEIRPYLIFSAFNNLVVGLPLIANHQFQCNIGGMVGLSMGSCIGYIVITYLTREAADRMNNPDMPEAFKGFPGTLLFLGILALALCGFSTPISFL